jgi:hypothetical protein
MTGLRNGLVAGSLALVAVLALCSATVRAEDEPVGVVVEPSDVTSAPTDEGAAANAGGGFDTPADAVQQDSGADLQPAPMTIEPNN